MNEIPHLRKLPIEFEEVAMAMETQYGDGKPYLDTQTGDLIFSPPELADRDLADKEVTDELPEWEQELVPLAREIQDGSDRYTPVPRMPSYEVYNLMVEFAVTVSDPRLRELLSVALHGKGAFGRFKSVLYNHPEEQDRWYAMKQATMEEWIRNWLADLGIEPVARNPAPG